MSASISNYSWTLKRINHETELIGKAKESDEVLHIKILTRNEKSFVVTGDTKPIRDDLKAHKGFFAISLMGWIFSNNYRDRFERLFLPEMENKKQEKIPGGKAKGRPDKDFNKTQLNKGIKVEMEHTTDRAIAKEIAKDHLTEDADYYKKLEIAEKAKLKDLQQLEKKAPETPQEKG